MLEINCGQHIKDNKYFKSTIKIDKDELDNVAEDKKIEITVSAYDNGGFFRKAINRETEYLYLKDPDLNINFSNDHVIEATSKNRLKDLTINVKDKDNKIIETIKLTPPHNSETEKGKLSVGSNTYNFNGQDQTKTEELDDNKYNKLFINQEYWNKMKINYGTRLEITATDVYGFSKTKKVNYVQPVISDVRIDESNMKFKLSKGNKNGINGNKMKFYQVYNLSSLNEFDNNKKVEEKLTPNAHPLYVYSEERDEYGLITLDKGKLLNILEEPENLKGTTFKIVVTDEYGIKAEHKYDGRDQSSGSTSGSSYSGYSSGETEINNADLEINSIEFLKKDGTTIGVNSEDNVYTNEITDEEITVRITYNNNVKLSNNTANNGWTISGGNVIVKKYTKGESETVSVTVAEGTKSSNIKLNIKLDTEYPVIKIDGIEVEPCRTKIKSEEDREKIYDMPYTGEIGRYIDKAQIEISDDGLKNLEEAKILSITCNGGAQEFKNKMTVQKLGTYKIIVEDKVGNVSVYMFYVTKDRNNINIDENIDKIEKIKNIIKDENNTEEEYEYDDTIPVIRFSTDKNVVILSDPNSTRQQFQYQLKLDKIDKETEISILNNGKKAERKNEQNPNEAASNEIIKTGMKLKIADVEYDMVVTGDIDGDGQIEPRDLNLAKYILALNALDNNTTKLEGISTDKISFDLDNLLLYIDEEATFDLDGNGKIDEDDTIHIEDYNSDGKIDQKDIEEIKKTLDVNEDGVFDEKDQELIRYALDINNDGTFNETDIINMLVDGNISLEKKNDDDDNSNEQLNNIEETVSKEQTVEDKLKEDEETENNDAEDETNEEE